MNKSQYHNYKASWIVGLAPTIVEHLFSFPCTCQLLMEEEESPIRFSHLSFILLSSLLILKHFLPANSKNLMMPFPDLFKPKFGILNVVFGATYDSELHVPINFDY